MGVRICLGIVGVNQDNEQKIVYSSSDPCDGLALMILSKNDDYKTSQKLDEILTAAEIASVKCTYGEHSLSVMEGYESYNPEFDTPKQLQYILDKIKRFYIKKILTDKTVNEYTFGKIVFYIATLSELYSALDIANAQGLQVALTLDDF